MLVGAILLYCVLHFLVFQVAKIDGSSMEPTLHNDDKVIVEILPYIFGSPEYGDIIAFPYPSDTSKNYVKRIIGKPGDVIDLRGESFFVNDVRLTDEFSQEPVRSLGNVEFPLTVPEDCYFVLGDNRRVSRDSRYTEVGCIKRETIIGKISFRIMPVDKIGFVN